MVKKYLLLNGITFIILALGGIILSYSFSSFPLTIFFLFLFVIFTGSALSTYGLIWLGRRRPGVFLSRLMATMFFRMAVYLAIVVVTVLNNRPLALIAGIQFAAIYLVFTSLEVSILTKEAKKM